MAKPDIAVPGDDVLAVVARLLAHGDAPAALAAAEREFSENPTAGAVCAMAVIAFQQGDLASAIRLLEPLAEGVQGDSDIPEALAVLNCLVGRVSEALFYGKLATVVQPDQLLLPLFGPKLPRYVDAFLKIEHKPLLGKSREAFNNGLFSEAVHAVEQHLQLFRDDVEALDHYAQCLMATGENRQAVGTLRSVLTLAGPSATLYSRLGQALVALGAFDQGMACHHQAVARAPNAAVLWAAMVHDWNYFPWGTCRAIDNAIAGLVAAVTAAGPKVARKAPEVRSKPHLVVGFLCNAPRTPEQRSVIADVARGFDRSRVRVVGFGPGELSEGVNNLYRGSFDVWRNTNKIDELTLAQMVRGEGIDVLIDADGLAARERHSLLLRNSAPLQYSWLNCPVHVGLPGSHGHLAGQPGLGHVGLLPLHSAPQGPVALPAAAAGGAIALGADVSLAELNAEVVRVWAAILHAVPNATLVLADHGFSDTDSGSRLVEMFGNFGVAHRVDVSAFTDPSAFFADIDVALAPFPVVRPLPYGVALGMGVPVVALAAGEFPIVLSALGDAAAQFLADGTEDYAARAVALVSDLDGLATVRATLAERLRASPAYSATAFAAEWERFFRDELAKMVRGEAEA
ncbi:MAG: hypothetical protein ACM31D_03540 [Bacteroidota bacterium]